MSIARMSKMGNSYRSITIAVDRYENQCMAGILYHAEETPGIEYCDFLEMVLLMNQIFDRMSCPKQTVEFRQFAGTGYQIPEVNEYTDFRKGKLATFKVYVKYRYHASWQGSLTWIEGERTEEFESLLQMARLADEILKGQSSLGDPGRVARICQIAVDGDDGGLMAGSVQNAYISHFEGFKGIIGLADAMVHLFESGLDVDSGTYSEEEKVVSAETWNAYQKGGRKATFVIKILYREHSTWQGRICWRESGEKRAFRSFLEMVMLIASALGSRSIGVECEDRYYIDNSEKYIREG